MTSASCVQPLLFFPVPSLASAWTALQSASRRYRTDRANPVQSRHNSDSAATVSQPEWVANACHLLGLNHLPTEEYAREEMANLVAFGSSLQPKLGGITSHHSSPSVSSSTFFENRFGFSESTLHRQSRFFGSVSGVERDLLAASMALRFVHQRGTSGPFWQQTRGFKTKRSIRTAGIGQQKASTVEDDGFLGMKFLRNTVFDKMQGTSQTASAAAGSSDRFRSLLADTETQAQDKMKIAFAEGYVAGDKRSATTNPVTTWSKRVVRFFWYALAMWLVLQLVQTYTAIGGNIKINVLKGDKFEVNPEEIAVTFDDVKGVDEAKQELSDIVDYLRNPEKFKVLGAKLPKGVLLVGPPGIGKSLLARAVAGEAGVPFFHASGSEFDEVFVGTGAKRVRQLFDAAKLRAPCIVFIDEIDTVGAKRTSSQIHPYANQTINQLLSEMDGFQQNEGVIVLGATNRRDNLDKALLRPGRFDVEVRVFPPDLKGRRDILDHYLGKVKMDSSVNVDKIARGTTGCTGADLENMVNQAALKAAMDGDQAVAMVHMEYARDKVLMGPAKKSKIPDDETNLITAYHEAGHTLVAYYTRDATPLNKVTIIPRGMSLGHTSFVPDKEEYNVTRSQLLARMDVAMGGRVAEEMIYGLEKVTTGASSDFQQATGIATAMVKQWGMSDKIGVRVFHDEDVDTGLSFLKLNELGPATTDIVDNEIRRLLQESYERARAILKTHATEHRLLAQALVKHETLDFEDIKAVVEGKSPPKLLGNGEK